MPAVRRRAFLTATLALGACAAPAATVTAPPTASEPRFLALRDRYFLRSLALYPVVSTYVGGDAVSPALAGVNGQLRDWSAAALGAEAAFLDGVRGELAAVDAAALSPGSRIDHALMTGQIAFTRRMLVTRRHHERSVDTYTSEPFRGVDWQLQQMAPAAAGRLGDAREWDLVRARVAAIPRYFAVARENLLAGKRSGNLPDRRMVARDGIASLEAGARYFRDELPALAKTRAGAPAPALALAESGALAADACGAFARFLAETYDPRETTDRYAAGADEYAFRLSLLGITRSAAELFDHGARRVAEAQARLFAAAEEIAHATPLPGLSFGTPAARRAGLAAVIAHLDAEAPRSDAELFGWYRDTVTRAVAFGRERALFDVPAGYRLDVLPLPEVLGSDPGASYYPAPAFKQSGVGRFYLTPTRNDPAALAGLRRADVAVTAVHEGFPGHDWNAQVMARHVREISNVRWLLPGEVEGSFSMWGDSLAGEGWALYAEALMAEPAPGRPHGLYTPAEHLSALTGALARAARVYLDVGLHTGRLTFDEGVDYWLENVELQTGARAAAAAGDARAAHALRRATGQIYRYGKWPTQAITYDLGRVEIERLRDEARGKLGARFALKRFHEELMKMGSIPPGLYAEELMARLSRGG